MILRFYICVFSINVFNVVNCTKNKNPANPSQIKDGDSKLLIVPDQGKYEWSKTDSSTSLYVLCYLTNQTDCIYYSKIGNRYNADINQKNLSVAKNTEGYVEKYDETVSGHSKCATHGQLKVYHL
jgi:hypothetical protein